jgi:RND family efflux transporter MFP subunit
MRSPVRIFAAVLALPFLVGAAACSAPPETRPDTSPAVAVTTATASQMDWPAHFDAGGVLRARTTAVIASRMLAPVLTVRVRPGDRVRQGQTLVELDAAGLDAQASRASAAVTAATEGGKAAAADVEGAEASLALAKATHARIAQLRAERAATAQELDEATAGLAAAESRLKGARARQSEAAAGLAALTSARVAATTDASYRTLTAPFDGVVIERSIDPGSMATPGTPLLVLESPSALQLEVNIDASRAAFITLGQKVQVHVDTDAPTAPGREGTVTEISRIDTGAHSFGVKIDLPGATGWRSGLFGRARFAGAPRKTIVIPAAAVIHRGQLSFVFVAADGHARLRAVSLGETSATGVEVLDGLGAGEAVLLAPAPALTDGARITTTGAGK